MKKDIKTFRSDIMFEIKKDLFVKPVSIFKNNKDKYSYSTIYYQSTTHKEEIKQALIKELNYFLEKLNLKKNYHAFIIGLGNDNHTPDSIGPKTLKYIQVNSHLEELGIDINNNKISALEPGVMGNTGIKTKRIIESVAQEIKPDLIILIDSYVSNNLDYLNKCIQITDKGIAPGSGLKGFPCEISFKTLHIPVIILGIPTAIEVKINKKRNIQTYFLASKDIDSYSLDISKIIASSLNEVLLSKR